MARPLLFSIEALRRRVLGVSDGNALDEELEMAHYAALEYLRDSSGGRQIFPAATRTERATAPTCLTNPVYLQDVPNEGTLQVSDAGVAVEVVRGRELNRIRPATSWSSSGASIEISYESGWSLEEVPDLVKMAVLSLAATWWVSNADDITTSDGVSVKPRKDDPPVVQRCIEFLRLGG